MTRMHNPPWTGVGAEAAFSGAVGSGALPRRTKDYDDARRGEDAEIMAFCLDTNKAKL